MQIHTLMFFFFNTTPLLVKYLNVTNSKSFYLLLIFYLNIYLFFCFQVNRFNCVDLVIRPFYLLCE